MQLKANSSLQKLRGGYYTPELLSDFIVRKIKPVKAVSILEPSCGNGVFLNSIAKIIPQELIILLNAVEIVKEEVDYVKSKSFGKNFCIHHDDFLNYYHKNGDVKYDIIVGNPPYIRYQYLTSRQRELQTEILKKNGMKPNRLINSWVCFLVACVELLEDEGMIGFVIPAELLQVAYGEELRQFLSSNLSEICLYTFRELVFPDIEQEIMVLIGKKSRVNSSAKISVIEFENFNDINNKLSKVDYQIVEHANEKWTKYFLSAEQNNLIRRARQDDRFYTFDEIATVNVGITTGNNKYFSVTEETINKYQLKDVVLPLIGRSSHAKGIYFTYDDWISNVKKGARACLINFPDTNYDDYPELHKQYIMEGEYKDDHVGYKCGIRDKWYIVPSVWVPDAFFLRRNNRFPKFVINNIDAVSTDTMHRIKFNKGINRDKVLLSYYNSITFAFTEINGRSYGGGVLEILPRELGSIILPNIQGINDAVANKLLKIVDDYIRNNKNIDELLDITDTIILYEYVGIDKNVIMQFREVWKKLMNRRHKRYRKALKQISE